MPAFPTHGYNRHLLDGFSSPGTEGFSSFQHHPSHHVAADTPPVRSSVSDSFRSVLAVFARYRPGLGERVNELLDRQIVVQKLFHFSLGPYDRGKTKEVPLSHV